MPTPSALLRFSWFVGGILLSWVTALDARAAELTPVTPAETVAYREKHQAEWGQKFARSEPRLFFAASEWARIVSEIRRASGRRAKYRQYVKEAADRLLTIPVRPYQPPEALVTPTHNLLQAKEEGWQRGFGDQLVVLALAAKVWPEEKAYGEKLRELALAACRFETWGRQGANGELADMDLAAGHVMRGLAVAYDWNRELFAKEDGALVRQVVRQRMNRMLTGLYGAVFWAGWFDQNHNHVAAAGLGLAGLAFLEEIPEAPDWLAGALLNFHRVGQSLAPDGSSYEGLPYWSYGRSYILQFIEGVKGVTDAADIYESTGLREAIAHRAGTSTPGFNGVIMWSDSRGFDVQGPHHILYRLGSVYRDGRGRFLADSLPFRPQGQGDALVWTLLWADETLPSETPRELDYHATAWDVATSRSGWKPSDYLLTVKSGRNSNHHTHLDAGSIALNVAGGWMLLAPGYGFGGGEPGFFDNASRRWEFFSNATESHSTLLVNGRNQRFDRGAVARIDHTISSSQTWWTEVDLSAIFADVTQARRYLLHRRGDYVLVLDDVQASQPVTVEWLAQMPPETIAEGNQLRLDVPTGAGLRIQAPDGVDFARRSPTTRVVDVSPSRLATFSTASTGSNLRLSHLLQPAADIAHAPSLRTSRSDTESTTRICVESPDWNDALLLARNGPARLEHAGISTQAYALVARTRAGSIESVLVRDARELAVSSVRLISSTPFDLALEKIGDAWSLTLATPFSGAFTRPEGQALFSESGAALPTSAGRSVSLPAGRYIIGEKAPLETHSAGSRAPLTTITSAAVATPPAASMDKLSGARVTWEAEGERSEQFGRAQQEANKDASGGGALFSIGTETPWHRVTWKVKVPVSGTYRLHLRYSLGQPRCVAHLQVDADSPSQASYLFALLGPKGWGNEREWRVKLTGWREADVKDEAGQTLMLPLEAGVRTITLSAPSEGLNLDNLTLDGTTPATGAKP